MNQTLESQSPLLSIADAQKFFGLARSSIYRLMNKGKLPWVQVGGRRKLDMADVLKYVRDHRICAPVSA